MINFSYDTHSGKDIIVVKECKVIANSKVLILRRDVDHIFLGKRESEKVKVLSLMLGLA